MSIEEHVEVNRGVVQLAKLYNLPVRGYISNAFECPFEGKVDGGRVVALASELREMGCYEIALADTTGMAAPAHVVDLIGRVGQAGGWGNDKVGLHLHDTYGTAKTSLTMAMAAHGLPFAETSVGGLGGCPYAPGATVRPHTDTRTHTFLLG